jgi:hypothetical protein
MSPDLPIEYACQFCMNGFDRPELACIDEPSGNCSGAYEVYFTRYEVRLIRCHNHATIAYQIQADLDSKYLSDSEADDDY